jgi:hypothetical protein
MPDTISTAPPPTPKVGGKLQPVPKKDWSSSMSFAFHRQQLMV